MSIAVRRLLAEASSMRSAERRGNDRARARGDDGQQTHVRCAAVRSRRAERSRRDLGARSAFTRTRLRLHIGRHAGTEVQRCDPRVRRAAAAGCCTRATAAGRRGGETCSGSWWRRRGRVVHPLELHVASVARELAGGGSAERPAVRLGGDDRGERRAMRARRTRGHGHDEPAAPTCSILLGRSAAGSSTRAGPATSGAGSRSGRRAARGAGARGATGSRSGGRPRAIRR